MSMTNNMKHITSAMTSAMSSAMTLGVAASVALFSFGCQRNYELYDSSDANSGQNSDQRAVARSAAGLPRTSDRFGRELPLDELVYRCTTASTGRTLKVGPQTQEISMRRSDRARTIALMEAPKMFLQSDRGVVSLTIENQRSLQTRAEYALGNASLELQMGGTSVSPESSIVCSRLENGEEVSKRLDPVRPPQDLKCLGELGDLKMDVVVPRINAHDSYRRIVLGENLDWEIIVWSHEGQLSIDAISRMDRKVYFSSQLFGSNPTQPGSVGLQTTLFGAQPIHFELTCRF